MQKIHKKRDNIKKKDNKTTKQPNVCTQIETKLKVYIHVQ